MFCLKFFKGDQRPFFRFAKEIYPGSFKPSPSHRFIAELEQRGKLLKNFTQNIDGLGRFSHFSLHLNVKFRARSRYQKRYTVPWSLPYSDMSRSNMPGQIQVFRHQRGYFLATDSALQKNTDKKKAYSTETK